MKCKKLKSTLLTLIIFLVMFCSGCAVLLIGAAATMTVAIVKKVASNPKALTEEERKKTEYCEIKGSREEILNATREAFVKMGYTLEELNFEKSNRDEKKTASNANFTFGKDEQPEPTSHWQPRDSWHLRRTICRPPW